MNFPKPLMSDYLHGLFNEMGDPASSFGWSLLIADPDR
jgi:hypothetical protein